MAASFDSTRPVGIPDTILTPLAPPPGTWSAPADTRPNTYQPTDTQHTTTPQHTPQGTPAAATARTGSSRSSRPSSSEDVALRLYSAAPVCWRGDSDLPQVPWTCPVHGLVLILDLWSGIGGLIFSALALGIRCVVLSAEVDPDLRAAKAGILLTWSRSSRWNRSTRTS